MTHRFDGSYWEEHWRRAAPGGGLPVHPYLQAETQHLPAGTALDAGCGTGSEALWLVEHGWQVTAADISATALARAADHARAAGLDDRVEWVQTDLARWEPGRRWDLVVTSYAHPDTDQVGFYRRIASWVAPDGTLLVVGHLPGQHHGHAHPEGATATATGITDVLAAPDWRIEARYENTRTVHAGGRAVPLHDVVVRARRTA
ncbi:class I SAM-dependent methyltransferase [Desertihabitans brevis]|uniref:Class I SAM-dependent methyltransferase n=1 Tax=Desertihabitans brevis TaxID=2268447 RepID=A0A367YTV3_9ACTN|nr:class I SAM-dependent methyltransferase [Desertihabitans brevis]RCK69323.1 class I SAM-dependent methyltransferase [Desertihabitans brevis]